MSKITKEIFERADEIASEAVGGGRGDESDAESHAVVRAYHESLGIDDDALAEMGMKASMEHLEYLAAERVTKLAGGLGAITPEDILSSLMSMWVDGCAVGIIAARMELAEGETDGNS